MESRDVLRAESVFLCFQSRVSKGTLETHQFRPVEMQLLRLHATAFMGRVQSCTSAATTKTSSDRNPAARTFRQTAACR